ncbi:hypothetical protein [Actinomadura gamaensis]|uniref:Uncharacterized protein n=1 Tax=Actinomadura gamaensis TaxID=1763541 RepID=A0ABV9TPG6_9ACTN
MFLFLHGYPRRRPMTATTAPPPLGPTSLTWAYLADTRLLLVGPRAAVLQNTREGRPRVR